MRRARRRRPLADDQRLPHGQPGADGRPGAAAHPPVPGPDRRGDLPAAGPGRWSRPRSRGSTATCCGPRRGGERRARATCCRTWPASRTRLRGMPAAADRDSLRGHEGAAAVALLRGPAAAAGPTGARRAALGDAQPPAAAGPLQRPAELRLRAAAHGGDAGGAGRRAWSRPWASSTRRAVPPTRWCWT